MRNLAPLALVLAALLVSGQENQRSPLDLISDTLCASSNGSSSLACAVHSALVKWGRSFARKGVILPSSPDLSLARAPSAWTLVGSQSPWSNRTGHGAISFQDKLWIVGGEGPRLASSGNGPLLEDVWSSSDGVAWTSPPPHNAWSGRHRFGIVNFNNKIWLLGGIASDANGTRQVTNEVWSSGVDATTWDQVRVNTPCGSGQTLCLPANASNTTAPIWAQRHTPVSMVHKGRMWIISGVRSSSEQTLAQTADFTHDVWSTIDGVTWERATESTPWSGRRTTVGTVYQLRMYVLAESSDFRYYYNVWGSTDGVTWVEPPGACTISGQLLGAALVIESGIVVIGTAGGFEDGLANTSLWYSKPDRDFDGVFDRSTTPVASGARAEAAYLSFLGKMWQIGGACGRCGPAQSRRTFNDVQVGTTLAFLPPLLGSGPSASWNFIATALCGAAAMLFVFY